MGIAVVVVVVSVALILVIGTIVFLAVRRRPSADGATATPPMPPPKVRPPEQPMTGLESALAQVTDRDGRPIRDRIEAEAGHVDELRVPDDTGPLLRRALDHVAPGESTANSADGAEPDVDEPA